MKKSLREIEREVKYLAAEQALEYNKLHKGKNNAAQATALHELKITQKAAESIYLSEFAKDQDAYVKYVSGSDKIMDTMRRLRNEGKIPDCIRRPTQEDYGTGTNFVHEQYCYLLMEILEGKHNDFLQSIIDKK